ncbi:MAG: acyltransferase [Bacteroidota bacterium]
MTQQPLHKQKINFAILDSLRGLASLYVVIAHCRGNLWIGGEKYLQQHPFSTWNIENWLVMLSMSLTKLSGEAVIFFFVLSGFSIAHSLNAQPKVGLFLLKRFIRLYPPYVLGFLLALFSVLLLKTNYDLYLSGQYETRTFDLFKNSVLLFQPQVIVNTLLYQPLMGTVITPYWSLVYEVIFYVGAIFFVRKLKWYYVVSIVLFVTGILLEITMPQFRINSILLKFALQYNFYFMVGIYTYHNLERLTKLKIMNNRYWVITLLFMYILMVGLQSLLGERFNVSFLVAAVSCVSMIIIFLKKNIRISALEKIGQYSYTLYVVHFSVITAIVWFLYSVIKLTPPDINNFFLWIPAVFVCVGVSYAMYFLAELPAKKLLSRLRKR